METHAMSLIRSGYAAAKRWGLLAVLFSALLALSLFHPSVAAAQEVKHIKLTEKQMKGFIVVSEHMAQLYHGANPDRPDPKLEVQAEALVKKNGFASLAEYDDVSTNIAIVLSGIDRQTKTFTEPPDQIKKEINSIKANKAIPEAQKREDLAQLGGRAKRRTAHSIQGKHRDGPQVFRSTSVAPGGGTCGLAFRECG
jgi:hypothetical protein